MGLDHDATKHFVFSAESWLLVCWSLGSCWWSLTQVQWVALVWPGQRFPQWEAPPQRCSAELLSSLLLKAPHWLVRRVSQWRWLAAIVTLSCLKRLVRGIAKFLKLEGLTRFELQTFNTLNHSHNSHRRIDISLLFFGQAI